MKYKVETIKEACGEDYYSWVLIRRLKNSTVGAPRYECTVILIKLGCETLRGGYTFVKSGYYQGEEDLAKEATMQILKELGLK